MTFADLTRNSFQSGVAPAKWVSLCRLYRSKLGDQSSDHDDTFDRDLANSIFILFALYPGDPVLQAYAGAAVGSGILPLRVFVATFLQAARARLDSGTLDGLCRAAVNSHTRSNPVILLSYGADTALVTIQDALFVLQSAYGFSGAPSHRLLESSSELIALLANTFTSSINIADTANISSDGAMACAEDAKALLHGFSDILTPSVQLALQNLVATLNLFTNDDPTLFRPAQLAQWAMGKDVLRSGDDNDSTMCILLLGHLVANKSRKYGAANDVHAVALIMAAFRSTSWTLQKFYAQLLSSALTWLLGASQPSIWRAFVLGRLPYLLMLHNKALENAESGLSPEVLSNAVRDAWDSLCLSPQAHPSLMQYSHGLAMEMTVLGEIPESGLSSLTRDITYQLRSEGLVDDAFVTKLGGLSISPTWAHMSTEAAENGSDLGTHLMQRLTLAFEGNSDEDVVAFVQKLREDYSAQRDFAQLVKARFSSAVSKFDIEIISHLCRILCSDVAVMDILCLHTPISEIVASGLAMFEDFDCETIGDPQTAVRHLGELVIFLQVATCRYALSDGPLMLGNRALNPTVLRTASLLHRPETLTAEQTPIIHTWYKTLFDKNSEGIEDSVLRSTRPKLLFELAATLCHAAISSCANPRPGGLDQEVLNTGLSYFLDPLLSWTLLGTVQALVRDLRVSKFKLLPMVHAFRMLITSDAFPRPLLALAAPSILRLFALPSLQPFFPKTLDVPAVRARARMALGLPTDGPDVALRFPPPVPTYDQSPVTSALRGALAALSPTSSRPPHLDVARCLLYVPPTKFLRILWDQLVLTLDLAAARKFAVHVLTTPTLPASPLLPLFVHIVLPNILEELDGGPAAELLASVLAASFMAALQLERALASMGEQISPLGESSAVIARSLAADLRHRKGSASAGLVAQRLASSKTFVTSFPVFKTDI